MTATALRRRRALYPPAWFPELRAVQEAWREIRDESVPAIARAAAELGRTAGSWILPLRAEPEDHDVIDERVCAEARALTPRTTALVARVPYVIAWAVSVLTPGTRIASHTHWNPYLSAILTLHDGGGSYLLVDGHRHDYVDGNLVVFDYTLPHEAHNVGSAPRYVLLMAIDLQRCVAHGCPLVTDPG